MDKTPFVAILMANTVSFTLVFVGCNWVCISLLGPLSCIISTVKGHKSELRSNRNYLTNHEIKITPLVIYGLVVIIKHMPCGWNMPSLKIYLIYSSELKSGMPYRKES